MPRCVTPNCALDAIPNNEKCILHCEKREYSDDFRKVDFLNNFYLAFTDDIVNKIFGLQNETDVINRNSIKLVLLDQDTERYRFEDKQRLLQQSTIIFNGIVFPGRDSRDNFDYCKLFKKLGGIHFDNCIFSASSIELDNTKVFFQNCLFMKRWDLGKSVLLESDRNVLYQACKFYNSVIVMNEEDQNRTVSVPLFSDCFFQKDLIFENVKVNTSIFNDQRANKGTIGKLHIRQSEINDKFILNNYTIDAFICSDSEFSGKVEFKTNDVKSVLIINTNFHKLLDCFQSSFVEFSITKCIFDDFVGFENCVFGNSKEPSNVKHLAVFKYATFMDFINFRNSEFKSGLDLTHVNLKEPPNFLNIDITSNITPRETYRIIKHSFDKIGNYIEGNKFHAFEMLKYMKESKNNKKRSTYYLLLIYDKISDYGQSFLRPFFLILGFSFIYWLIGKGYDQNILYKIWPPLNSIFDGMATIINDIARHIIPFSKFLREGMESLSLVFYIIFSIMIWLVVLAIKRKTKR